MRNAQVSDEWLYLHMPALGEKMSDALPDEEEIEYKFSERFQKKMKILLKRAVQKEKYKIPVTTWRRTAASIAVVLSGILMASLGVEAIRTEIYEFIQRNYKTFTRTEYQVIKNEPVEFVPLYPEYIPEGYEMDEKVLREDYFVLSYLHSSGAGFSIQQVQVTNGMAVYEDNEYISQKEVEVWEQEALLSKKEDGSVHVRWKTDACLYQVVAIYLSEQDILKICNSLKE